jgi:hypothetical protein
MLTHRSNWMCYQRHTDLLRSYKPRHVTDCCPRALVEEALALESGRVVRVCQQTAARDRGPQVRAGARGRHVRHRPRHRNCRCHLDAKRDRHRNTLLQRRRCNILLHNMIPKCVERW